jgi:hypothetical protein
VRPFARKLALAALAASFACPATYGLTRARHAHARHFHGRHKKRSHRHWYDRRAFPPTRDSLARQNAAIDAMGLERIRNARMLRAMVADRRLVPITVNSYVQVSPRLERNRRYCRPWVDAFLQELGRDYFTRFGEPIQVNSAARTVRTQIWLLRWNRNAAPWHGEKASAHLAGVAVDLRRRGLSREQIGFVQQKLLYFSNLGMVIVEEELRQPCFHVVVTGEYPYPPPLSVILSNPDPEVINAVFDRISD